jgi:cytochrome b subunit of formate dehydrogenase
MKKMLYPTIISDFKCFITLIALSFFLSAFSTGLAQSNEDCLGCHSDNEMTMEKNGKEVSIYVNENILHNSSHKKLQCVNCHTGFDPESIPHKEEITSVNCKSCHENAGVKHPFHPQILKAKGTNGTPDVNCKNCHGTHNVLPIRNEKSPFNQARLTESCGKCHQGKTEEFIHSIHYKAVTEKIKGAPDCISCHEKPITAKNVQRDTLQVKIAQEKLCLSCHLDNPEVKNRVTPTGSFISAYEHSVHGQALMKGNVKAANCVDCHGSHKIAVGSDLNSSVFKLNVPKTCGKCHSDITKEYNESVHGMSVARGRMDSPVCTDCHGEHNILKTDDPESPVSYQRLSSQVCSPCHTSVGLSEKYGLDVSKFKTYMDSYHGLALKGGSKVVANCASCHGVHNIKPSSDPASTIHKSKLAETCGSCHPGANERFAEGKVHVTNVKEDDPALYWISTTYIILILTTVGGMLFHNFIDFIKKSKRRMQIRRGTIKVEHHGHSLYLRMSVGERIQHFSLLISFITLVITGFMLRFPDAWWVRHIRDFIPDAFEYRSLLHRIAAVVMVAASLYHIYYLAATTRGRQLLKDLLPRMQDMRDAVGVFKYNLGLSTEKPLLDRFSYVEKVEYWALIWGTVIMTLTGIAMWFENTFIGMTSKLGWDIARTIHYYEAWLAFLSIVIWHFYFVMFNPDIYPMNLAWIKGTISEEEMAEEHPLELERIKKAQQDEDSKS